MTAAMNGAACVLVKSAISCANKPAQIAATPFKVVITPKRSLKDPASSRCRRWNSVTIQLSITLYISVVERPPNIRPAKSTRIESDRTVKHDMEYATQKKRQAVFRPYRSASDPTKEADIAAARNPVVNRWATVSSDSAFSSWNTRQFQSNAGYLFSYLCTWYRYTAP